MSEFSSFNKVNVPTSVKESKTEIVLAESIKELVNLFKGITEYSEHELKIFTLLKTNKYHSKLLEFRLANKPHIKRKYAKEILEALKLIASTIANKQEPEQSEGLLHNLLHRNK